LCIRAKKICMSLHTRRSVRSPNRRRTPGTRTWCTSTSLSLTTGRAGAGKVAMESRGRTLARQCSSHSDSRVHNRDPGARSVAGRPGSDA
jgi:hypothetical protein